jgi:hypothetical protein
MGTNHVPPGFGTGPGWARATQAVNVITNAKVRFYTAAGGDVNYTANDGSVMTVRIVGDPRYDSDVVEVQQSGSYGARFLYAHKDHLEAY